MTWFKQGSKQQPKNLHHWTMIPFHGPLLTRLVMNGKVIVMGWDTGSVPGVMKQSSVKRFEKQPGPANQPYGHNKACVTIISTMVTMQAGQPIKPTWFLVKPFSAVAPFNGLMGANFFSQHRVYVDFEHKKIYVRSTFVNHQPPVLQEEKK